jgi:putative Mn2+ efflux pump MntP
MYVIFFFILPIALGLGVMFLMRQCAENMRIQLPSGLLISGALAVVHVALFCVGMRVGNFLRFEVPEEPDAFVRANALVCVGLTLLVSVKMIWPYVGKKKAPIGFDLTKGFGGVFLFAIASGINGFLVATGVGFVESLSGNVHFVVWPLLAFTFVFSYLGIMFGRQQVPLRPRRWMAVSGLFLVAMAVSVLMKS